MLGMPEACTQGHDRNAYQLAQRQQNRLISFHPNRLCGTSAWALLPKMTANELPSKTKEKQ
jgi:hypothetical protein